MSASFTTGNASSVSPMDNRSLGVAEPNANLAVSRSRSWTFFKASLSFSRIMLPETSSSTASRRLFILSASCKGCSIYFLSVLAPIAVQVLSSTLISEPCRLPSLAREVSSRLRRVAASSIIKDLSLR